jgi:antitoxin PrlF
VELKAKITSKGQLTIPKEVRRVLGVRKGDSLLFDVDDRARVVREPVSFAEYVGIWREEGEGA